MLDDPVESAAREVRELNTRTDIEEHLRTASDAILLLVSQVSDLERHKRGVPPNDARFDELARQVREAAQRLADFAEQEESWARRAISDHADRFPNIDAIAPPPTLAELLGRWRAVERQLNEAEPGSDESKRLFAEFEAARDDYMRAFRRRASTGD